MTPLAAARRALALLALALPAAACTAGTDGTAAPAAPAAPDASSSAPSASSTPSPGAAGPDYGRPAATPACADVRAGIDAFNLSDYDAAVAAFDRALPLARQQAEEYAVPPARRLLEAVSYYAALDADELAAAFPPAPEDRKYQLVTLAQCQPTGPGPTESPDVQT